MAETAPIVYWNREKKREETERVYGDAFVRFLYGNPAGKTLANTLLSRAAFSHAYGAYQASPLSRHKIHPFIREFGIPMEEYDSGPFRSFNDFFIRKFKPGARAFATDPDRLPAPAEARYLAWERVEAGARYPVKGEWLSADKLLGGAERARPFSNGPLVIARLCPTDYHRFHYPDDGSTTESYSIPGRLHSVNPLALRFKGEIFATNERAVSILETRRFGRLAYIEVGAMCVGKIVQTHPPDVRFRRGDEKGYFLFGASTVILIGEPGRWSPDADLLEQTRRERETFVKLGDAIALARK